MSESGESTFGEIGANLALTGAGATYYGLTEKAIPAVSKIVKNVIGGGGTTVIQPQ